jgi:hypothetical protein
LRGVLLANGLADLSSTLPPDPPPAMDEPGKE